MALAAPVARGLPSFSGRLLDATRSQVSKLSPVSCLQLAPSSSAPAAFRPLHTSVSAWQAKAAAQKPVAAGSPAAGGAVAPDRVFDFKPVLAPHQAVYSHPSGPIKYSSTSPLWKPSSVRPGVLLLKVGMVSDYDSWGQRRALTALKIDQQAVVVGHATQETRGYTAIQIGAGIAKHVNRPFRYHLKKQGLDPDVVLPDGTLKHPPPQEVVEFRVTPDVLEALPVGTQFNARHFVPGQYVDVRGTTQGKGFQGGMKRHGFRGQGASHGNSVSHRVLGSTGCRQDPGRVFKGKKMPGRMGGDNITVQRLRVYKVDVTRNVVYVQGAVPGKAGSYVRVTDSTSACKKPWSEAFQPPFPTYALTADDQKLIQLWAEARESGKLLQALGASSGASPSSSGLPSGLPPYELVAEQTAVDPFAVPENDEAEEV